MTTLALSDPAVRVRFERAADFAAAAAAASIPWSTSATSILIGVWLVCLLPTIDWREFWRSVAIPAAYLPVALVALFLLGMLWADVPLKERFSGLSPYIKLLTIPLLMWQFSQRDEGERALRFFLMSAAVLLIVSWVFMSAVPSKLYSHQNGIPVKDYISQSGVFTLCVVALAERAIAIWPSSQKQAILVAALGCAFLADIIFVASSRTTLIVILVLFGLLGIMHLSRRGIVILTALLVVLIATSWSASSYLRKRVDSVATDLQTFSDTNDTSAGARLAFWKNSLSIIRDAPVIGHGTGSTRAMFAKVTGIDASAPGAASNPHNQVFAVAIPLGTVGALLLVAMWGSHVRLFWASDFAAWIGLIVVVQNIVSSMFNSHLLDFTQGWLYVWGVGVAGGMVLRRRALSAPPP